MLDSLAENREDSALNWLYDRAVGVAVAADKRVAKLSGTRDNTPRKLKLHSLEELREDYARISARSQKHALAESFEVMRHDLVGLSVVYSVFKGGAHIGAGVAVRHGKDVELIDFLFPLAQVGKTVAHHLFKLRAVYFLVFHSNYYNQPSALISFSSIAFSSTRPFEIGLPI